MPLSENDSSVPAPTRVHELLDRTVARFPDRLACIDHDGRRVSYDALGDAVDAAETALKAAGLGAGDRAFIVADNSVTTAAFLLACSRLDAWFVPISPRLAGEEIDLMRAHARPKLILFTPATSRAAADHAARFGADPVAAGAAGNVAIRVDPESAPEPVFAAAADQVAALMYTTGTTAAPKGVMLSHRNLLHAAATAASFRGYREADRCCCVLPLTHIYGLTQILLPAIAVGATTHFVAPMPVAKVAKSLADGATTLIAVPQMFAWLLLYYEAEPVAAPPSRLRYLEVGGSPLDLDLKQRVEAQFHCPLINAYGLTEGTGAVVSVAPGCHREDDAIGVAYPGVELAVRPRPGTADEADGCGEICVRGPDVMVGYYRDPETTAAEVDGEGWLKTGDLGRFGDDGALFLVGRCKEIIICGGLNVHPAEIEAALNRHPGVAGAAAVGWPRPDGDEQIAAFVVPADAAALDERDLRAFLGDKLASYKLPSRIVIVDSLPSAASGKVLKHKLLDTFADRL